MKKFAFTLIELLVVISIIALLIGILLPALGAARKTANKAKNQTQVRGIVQNATVYAASNSDKLPNQSTTGNDGASSSQYAPANATTSLKNGENRASVVYNMLVRGDLSPELLVNPVDISGIAVSTDNIIEITNASSAEFSYAWINQKSTYYKNDTDSLTPLISDRATDNTGANDEGGQLSVWNLSGNASATSWEGSIGWADGHASHVTSGNDVGTGTGQINTSWATDTTGKNMHDPAAGEAASNALLFN